MTSENTQSQLSVDQPAHHHQTAQPTVIRALAESPMPRPALARWLAEQLGASPRAA